MKTYTIYYTEPVAYTYTGDEWNKETKRWEKTEITEMKSVYTFYSLANAKKHIKANIDKYVSSCITKIWANGDFENLGKIKIKGNNKIFVANTKQKKASY